MSVWGFEMLAFFVVNAEGWYWYGLASEIQRTLAPLKSWLSSFSTAVARSPAVSYSTKLRIVGQRYPE